jgi:hypothetical protein
VGGRLPTLNVLRTDAIKCMQCRVLHKTDEGNNQTGGILEKKRTEDLNWVSA